MRCAVLVKPIKLVASGIKQFVQNWGISENWRSILELECYMNPFGIIKEEFS